MAALQGVQLGDYHTLRDWGLYLVVGGTTVGEAEVDDSLLIKVPFGDRLLNLTKSIDGKVHYTQRKITITLKCVKPKRFWPSVQSALENALQGQWLRCIFDDDVVLGGPVESGTPEPRPVGKCLCHHRHLQSLQSQPHGCRWRGLAVGYLQFRDRHHL